MIEVWKSCGRNVINFYIRVDLCHILGIVVEAKNYNSNLYGNHLVEVW